ncbi:MAG: glycerol kinase GlpK [Ruminococcaceae bacterium]|nr:glycerol kinase GlpK [Oscillospiraceae bacterium]
MKRYIIALDAGTTSSRCIVFDRTLRIVSVAQKEFPQIFPKDGWVEHDPDDIYFTQLEVAKAALEKARISPSEVEAIGITNQRETVIVWDKNTGKPIYNAIVWQCRRTAEACEKLRNDGCEELIRKKTGLVIDSYFSATKIKWILDNVQGAREKAERGELLFGTVDCWLIYNLTGGASHVTDVSNASRTMLFNINTMSWDEELLALFGIPSSMLPTVLPSCGLFGHTDPSLFGVPIAISGVAGDQQSALFGQCCFSKGDVKNTYGTGGFMLMNTGDTPIFSDNGLLTTVGWTINGKTSYVLEGSVFICGAAIQWLRDGIGIIDKAYESEACALSVESTGGVYFVPAFVGLGAPYWDPYARGAILGITRGTTRAHIVRAAVEAMAFQTYDVIKLMEDELGCRINDLRVDGGACANNFLLSFQADILDKKIIRPECIETTALGAAALAGLAVGYFSSTEDIKKNIAVSRIFEPNIDDVSRSSKIDLWHKAVSRALSFAE